MTDNPPVPTIQSQQFLSQEKNGLVAGDSVVNGSNDNLNGLMFRGVANGVITNGRRTRRGEAAVSGERTVAGVCRSEEGRVKVFLKVASQEEE